MRERLQICKILLTLYTYLPRIDGLGSRHHFYPLCDIDWCVHERKPSEPPFEFSSEQVRELYSHAKIYEHVSRATVLAVIGVDKVDDPCSSSLCRDIDIDFRYYGASFFVPTSRVQLFLDQAQLHAISIEVALDLDQLLLRIAA
jgi:hypothetical protein